jgi:hypothetical protein
MKHESRPEFLNNFTAKAISLAAAGALTLAACSSSNENTAVADPVQTTLEQEVEVEVDQTVNDTQNNTESEQPTSTVDETDSSDNGENNIDTNNIDTSYWNLSEDKVEILSYLATEHDYPVSAEPGNFSENTPAHEIAFGMVRAFQASRNTRSLLPLAQYQGFSSVEEWNDNSSTNVYDLEEYFAENLLRTSIDSPEDGYAVFDSLMGGITGEYNHETVVEEILADGSRRISGEQYQEYIFNLPVNYGGNGLADESFSYLLDETTWSESFPQSYLEYFDMSFVIRPDGGIAELTIVSSIEDN